jgi:hypothetical protein
MRHTLILTSPKVKTLMKLYDKIQDKLLSFEERNNITMDPHGTEDGALVDSDDADEAYRVTAAKHRRLRDDDDDDDDDPMDATVAGSSEDDGDRWTTPTPMGTGGVEH